VFGAPSALHQHQHVVPLNQSRRSGVPRKANNNRVVASLNDPCSRFSRLPSSTLTQFRNSELESLVEELYGVPLGAACLPGLDILTTILQAGSRGDVLVPKSFVFMTQRPFSLHAVDTTTSTPSSDIDWVSPFTLPPLPTFARRKTTLSPLHRQHQRSKAAHITQRLGARLTQPRVRHTRLRLASAA